jgi:hypothetical protein
MISSYNTRSPAISQKCNPARALRPASKPLFEAPGNIYHFKKIIGLLNTNLLEGCAECRVVSGQRRGVAERGPSASIAFSAWGVAPTNAIPFGSKKYFRSHGTFFITLLKALRMPHSHYYRQVRSSFESRSSPYQAIPWPCMPCLW